MSKPVGYQTCRTYGCGMVEVGTRPTYCSYCKIDRARASRRRSTAARKARRIADDLQASAECRGGL